ncbi:MAG: ParA family protein [Thiotrichaceae bacterium]|nr:ParA family protein [Thiotrichaceae bacterium]
MAKIIAIANQKGGVGKTTTSVNLAASLAVVKKTVLIIDMDPQGNATTGMGLDKHDQEILISEVLLEGTAAEKAIQKIPDINVDMLAGGPCLTDVEIGLMREDNREYRLREALSAIKDQYDYIIIDCPPSLSMLTVNSLVAADSVIIPMQCEYYALEGLSALIGSIETIKEASNPSLEVIGLLRTMYDPRSNLARDVSNQLTEYFGKKLYSTSIPRNIRLAEAPSHGIPVLFYDKRSRGALAYLAMANELVQRESGSVTS